MVVGYGRLDLRMRILFLCTGNSARSQMVEDILRRVGEDKGEVFSAGTFPLSLHPTAVRVLREVGIDISAQQSKSVDSFLHQPFFPWDINVSHFRGRNNCRELISK
jgi:arsenate reductase (thioredoxin)